MGIYSEEQGEYFYLHYIFYNKKMMEDYIWLLDRESDLNLFVNFRKPHTSEWYLAISIITNLFSIHRQHLKNIQSQYINKKTVIFDGIKRMFHNFFYVS